MEAIITELLKVGGPLAIMLAYFVYTDWQNRKRFDQRQEKFDQTHQGLLQQTLTALEENTEQVAKFANSTDNLVRTIERLPCAYNRPTQPQ